MYRNLRRKDKELTKENKIINILIEGDYGTLGTFSKNGYPYTTPMNYVYKSGVIYLHSAVKGHKIDNINYCSKVSFTVVGLSKVVPENFTTVYRSVNIQGKSSIVEGIEKKEALKEFINKYSPSYKERGVDYIQNSFDKVKIIKIEIEKITGKGDKL